MGVEPFLVASSLVATAAQRLCRKICTACKEPDEVTPSVLKRLNMKSEGITFYHGKGCKKCNNTGYYGRMGILEVFLVDDAVREMIVKKKSADEMKEYAVSKGMMTLRDNAFKICGLGLTTIEEVLRVTAEE
jgi:type II secretory ATPase GspE/PulE/Tfp pilus assembly ATPase PilB-like protein